VGVSQRVVVHVQVGEAGEGLRTRDEMKSSRGCSRTLLFRCLGMGGRGGGPPSLSRCRWRCGCKVGGSRATRQTSHVNESPEIERGDIQRGSGGAAGKRQRYQQQLPAVQKRYTNTRHTSHVTRHMSHVTCHTSHVTRHTSQEGTPHMKQQTALPPATAIVPPLLLTSSMLQSRVTHASTASRVTTRW
jgi:hypothetical protein